MNKYLNFLANVGLVIFCFLGLCLLTELVILIGHDIIRGRFP